MLNVRDYIDWAVDKVGVWHYLYGTVRRQTTADALNERYINHYAKSMTRAEYDKLTRDWQPTDYATDCQGLLDAYMTYVVGETTDINANMNYEYWCEEKGNIEDISRPFVIGEAVFMQSSSTGKMTHIGWVCEFDGSEPVIVEARGIAYGVVKTRYSSRKWTHRGLMTKKFEYSEDNDMEQVVFEAVSPMPTGDAYLAMQAALNAAGYTDDNGAKLEADGKWGKKSQQAFDKLIADYTPAQEPQIVPITVIKPIMPPTVARLTFADDGLVACIVRAEDIPED